VLVEQGGLDTARVRTAPPPGPERDEPDTGPLVLFDLDSGSEE
jgi:hypothetical protein